MKTNSFLQGNKIILAHLKINWKIILFFIIFITIIGIGTLLIPITDSQNESNHKLYIIPHADISIYNYMGKYRVIMGNPSISIAGVLNAFLLSGPGIALFSVPLLLMISSVFIKDIKGGRISLWMTLPISRAQIFLSKLTFIFISFSMMYAPLFLEILLTSATAADAADNIGLVILNLFQFYACMLMVISIYVLITILLSEQSVVAQIINALIILFIVAVWLLSYLGIMINESVSVGGKRTWLENFKYVSVVAFMFNPLKYIRPGDEELSNVSGLVDGQTISYYLTGTIALSIASPFYILAISAAFAYGTNYAFAQKDLNI